MTNDIKTFCEQFSACKEGIEWAIANCTDMADVWDTIKPDWLIWIATRKGILDDRGLRLFACWSVRKIWDLLTDERSRNAVEIAEKYAEGNASPFELSAARAVSAKASWNTTIRPDAWAVTAAAAEAAKAAWYTTWAAAGDATVAAWGAAGAAALAAVAAIGPAAWNSAIGAAAADAARVAAWKEQASWLRAAYPNPFGMQ